MKMTCTAPSITATGHIDGFGAQYAAMISVFALSRRLNITYCATPWTVMGHNIDPIKMYQFVGGDAYGPLANNTTTPFFDAHSQAKGYYEKDHLIHTTVRAAYFKYAKPPLLWNQSSFNIAVHIRRGDVHSETTDRWVEPQDILRCVASVLKRHPSSSLHVYSEGSKSSLSYLDEFNPVFHLESDLKSTFHHMVMADAFIMAKSSLSWSASFISTGIIYSPFRSNHRIKFC